MKLMLAILLGGFFGFALTYVGALGSNGLKKALVAVIGGLLGAFSFSLSYGYLKNLGLFNALNMGK